MWEEVQVFCGDDECGPPEGTGGIFGIYEDDLLSECGVHFRSGVGNGLRSGSERVSGTIDRVWECEKAN